ncbi:helix-turn-helix domain-containing protein [Alicyclobacillus dauci]|uniref:Helix-turn-helix domain-containing protein n=1 Tax=Alicyclobacillus dauci TaxID=1475485 RepID=A0ABY6Z2B4_9BACL|nr:helix-turn-helix domain-containing protein [Alicyclobacillus dauci]WAH37039.1 helix-turn-helix domain-containing protein [Alicyclobacillus dauci]
MAKTPDLSTDEQNQAISLFEMGWSVKQVALKLNRSTSAIRRVLKKNGYELEGRRLSTEEKERILKFYSNGCTSIAAIARELNRGETSVARVFKEYGLKTVNPRALHESEKKMVISLYRQGHNSIAEIARLTGRGETAIGRVFKQNNLSHSRRFRKDFSQKQINHMVAMYRDNSTSGQIAEEFQVSDDTVLTILKEAQVVIRPRQYRLSGIRNHDYFAIIDTPEKAYFLGLIIADGSVGIRKNSTNASRRLCIQLQERDAYILQELKRQLGGQDNIIRYTNRREAYFNVSSQQLCDDLARYGVVPRKTGHEVLPTIADELMPHLIRGVFDGDGCACLRTNNRLSVDICGSLALCQGVKEYLKRMIGVNDNKIYTRENQNIHIFSFAERRDVWNFYHLIYRDSTIYLERKKQKFTQFFESRNMKYDPYAVGITCHTSTKLDPISIR